MALILQLLLRKKAAEQLKKEQEEKAKIRRATIDERCGKPKSINGLSESKFLFRCILKNMFNYLFFNKMQANLSKYAMNIMPKYAKSKVTFMIKKKKWNGKIIKLMSSISLSMTCEENSKRITNF